MPCLNRFTLFPGIHCKRIGFVFIPMMGKPKHYVKKFLSFDQASQWTGKGVSFAILDTCILLCLGLSGTPCPWDELNCFMNLSLRLRCLSPHSKEPLFHHAFSGRVRPDSSVGPLLLEGNMPYKRSCVALVGFFSISWHGSEELSSRWSLVMIYIF